MSSSVSFILTGDALTEGLNDSVRSINCLGEFTKQIIYAVPGVDSAGQLIPDHDSASILTAELRARAFNEALSKADCDFVQLVESGDILDPQAFDIRVQMLANTPNACALLSNCPDGTMEDQELVPGPQFLHRSIENLCAVVNKPSQLLLRATGNLPLLDHTLGSLSLHDFVFQLSKHGAVLVNTMEKSGAYPAFKPSDWLKLFIKYRSLLKCMGFSREYLMEGLAAEVLKGEHMTKLRKLRPADRGTYINNLLSAEETNFGLEQTVKIELASSALELVKRRGFRKLRTIRVASEDFELDPYHAIDAKERELRSLLQCTSWKLTKFLRDLRYIIQYRNFNNHSQDIEDFDDTFSGYMAHLQREIDKIKGSLSWRISAPFRFMTSSSGSIQLRAD